MEAIGIASRRAMKIRIHGWTVSLYLYFYLYFCLYLSLFLPSSAFAHAYLLKSIPARRATFSPPPRESNSGSMSA